MTIMYPYLPSRLRLRVLPRQLRSLTFQPPVLAIESRLAAPGALQLVAHVEAQPAESLGLDLDFVSVLESVQAAMVGAGGEDVARFHGMYRAHPFDAARDLVRHIARVEVLFEIA